VYHVCLRYDTIEEINVDSKAEYTAFVCYLTNGSTVLAQYRHVTDGQNTYTYDARAAFRSWCIIVEILPLFTSLGESFFFIVVAALDGFALQ